MPTELDKKLTDIIFKASGGVSDMGAEEVRAIKKAVEKYVIGELEPTPPTVEWVTWGEGMQQHLLGKNSKVMELRQSLWGDKA
ncbi:hypothetical protein [Pseudarthrobacter sp. ATCC 49987]|uniref:hypothetical protein n=1 Tax=Pseudarthrobacter sp. ATCC 49987 TaxID=2698204 RepID=UPI001367C3D4|nr:hypothetical protein [Pseudarthrobacter sp. ATCC 49987]